MTDTAVKTGLFGTDGIRGKVGIFPITPDFMFQIGYAVGHYFKQQAPEPRILIGKDTRESGAAIEEALAAGICSAGAHAVFIGFIPTPGVAFLTQKTSADAGIVISASHNPFDDNGIKIFEKNGKKLSREGETAIEQLCHSFSGPRIVKETSTQSTTSVEEYVHFLASFLEENALRGFKIVLDCAHGAAFDIAPKLFRSFNAELKILGASPSGTNINSNCGALYPQNLAAEVIRSGAHIGIAFDGDADRVVFVDEAGYVMDGDEFLAIVATHLAKKGLLKKQTVVATVMSNMGLEIALRKQGISVIRTQVGDKYVSEAMLAGGFNLGGEQSGHLIFGDHTSTGDGILAALILLGIMKETGLALSELRACMERCPQVLKNIDVPEKIPLKDIPRLDSLIQSMEKSLGSEGRVLFRYSGTERKARIMIEGLNQEQIESMVDELAISAEGFIKRHCDTLRIG